MNILYPIFAMVALTFAVSFRMFAVRMREMQEFRIHPQKVSMSTQSKTDWRDVRSSDNFKNLFEMPVLFYAFCLSVAVTNRANLGLIVGAWIYVVLRYAHSYIHCTYNQVMHRFFAFFASSMVLLALWLVLGFALLFD